MKRRLLEHRCMQCGAEAFLTGETSVDGAIAKIVHGDSCVSMSRQNEYFRPDMRPSWEAIFTNFAQSLSSRSTCRRAAVGCVIVSQDNCRVLAIGYNGNYRGGTNDCDSEVPGSCGCSHAEMNALIKLDYNDPSPRTMYVTESPCRACAKATINARIDRVVYAKEYRDRSGLELLESSQVETVLYRPPIDDEA